MHIYGFLRSVDFASQAYAKYIPIPEADIERAPLDLDGKSALMSSCINTWAPCREGNYMPATYMYRRNVFEVKVDAPFERRA